MDAHYVEPPLAVAEVVRRAVDQVMGGDDAVLSGGFNAALALDGIESELADRRVRVLRAAAPVSNKLSLSCLLAQITGRPDLDGHDDEVLEHGFKALTSPGDACDGIALLVDSAEALQGSALLYLQLVGRTAPTLRFVFAGEDGLPDLADDKMADLRIRLTARPVLALAGMSSAALLPCAGLPEAGLVPAPPTRPLPAPPGPTPGGMVPFIPLRPDLPPPGLLPSPPVSALSAQAARTSISTLGVVPASASAGPSATVPADVPAQAGRQTAGHHRAAAWVGVGVAMAACLALGVFIGRWNRPGAAMVMPNSEPAAIPAAAAADAGAASSQAVASQPVAPQPRVSQPAGPQLTVTAPVAAAPPSPQPDLASGGLPAQAASPAAADQATPDAGRPVPDAPQRASAARPPNTASRPRTATRHDADAPSREAATFSRDATPSRQQRRTGQAGSARDLRAPDSSEGERHTSWPPTLRAPRPDRPGIGQPGGDQPTIGTFTTGPDGLRTFRLVP